MEKTMTLKLSQLALFCALVEQGTIHAAAEKMHCVPSNITSRIKELEGHLGVALFDRQHRKLSITPEGRAFYRQATQLIQQALHCQNLFKQSTLIGHLQIGALNSVVEHYIHQQTIQFLKQHPTVEVNISCGNSLQLIEQLLNGDCDLIFVAGGIEHPLLQSRTLFSEQLYLVCNQHSVNTFKQQAAGQILFSHGAPSVHDLILKHWLAQHQIEVQRQCDIESYPLLLDAVQQRIGFSVIPSVYLAQAQQRQLHCLALDQRNSCDISIAWKKSNSSALIQSFAACFKSLDADS